VFAQEWNPHFFALTSTKLHYTEETNTINQNDEDEEATNQINTEHEVADTRHVFLLKIQIFDLKSIKICIIFTSLHFTIRFECCIQPGY